MRGVLAQLGTLDSAALVLRVAFGLTLALMHGHRLLHRDVTPRNVRLTADGRAKLIDFGVLGTFGTAVQIVGTLPCIAPEVMRRLPLDQRTDLFALGAIAYWALTGRHAYPARRAQELWSLWQTPPLPPSQLAEGIPPEKLERIHGPVGLEIGSETPEEIALSIMAEIVAAAHSR